MKKILILLCIIGIVCGFNGCSKREGTDSIKETASENSIYNWPCPIDGIAWGISSEELIEYYKWDEKEYQEDTISDNMIELVPTKKIKIYGYKAKIYFQIDVKYG